MTLWWHVYGSELPGITEETDEDPEGYGWAQVTLGESTMEPERLQEVLPETPVSISEVIGGTLPYLTSFDHEPTHEEIQILMPEQYRDEEYVGAYVIDEEE